MNEEEIKKIVNESADYSDKNTFESMLKDFYNKKMVSMVILTWGMGLVFIAGAIVSAVLFFQTVSTQYQIVYASLFITFMLFLAIIKIFAWQLIHRNGILREIKKLELRIAEMSRILKDK